MPDNPVIRLLGRRLRLGLVGGGGAALIGPVHRAAARLDDRFEIAAAVLSSSPERSLAEATALGIPRGYGDLDAMLAAERARADGIDALVVATPNDSHGDVAGRALDAGLHVICDKPLTNDTASALAIARKVEATGLVFCLTHNYSGYPMVRQARAMVAAGELGPIRLVHVSYVQGSLGARVEDRPEDMPARLKWRLDPKQGGPSHVMGDIGTHAHQLLTFIAGERVRRVMAEVGAVLPGRAAHDTGMALVELEHGAKGVLLASKAATGAENALAIEIYGEAGGLYWEQANVNTLRHMRNAEPARLLTRGLPGLHPLARRAARIPPGHPEGFHEGFANLYTDFADTVAARLAGADPDPLALHFPSALDGARGLAFIDATLRSTSEGRWVDVEEPR
jgi:predicted dehydrogenase